MQTVVQAGSHPQASPEHGSTLQPPTEQSSAVQVNPTNLKTASSAKNVLNYLHRKMWKLYKQMFK